MLVSDLMKELLFLFLVCAHAIDIKYQLEINQTSVLHALNYFGPHYHDW